MKKIILCLVILISTLSFGKISKNIIEDPLFTIKYKTFETPYHTMVSYKARINGGVKENEVLAYLIYKFENEGYEFEKSITLVEGYSAYTRSDNVLVFKNKKK